MRGARPVLRVQSNGFLNFLSSKIRSSAGQKRLFCPADHSLSEWFKKAYGVKDDIKMYIYASFASTRQKSWERITGSAFCQQ